MASTMRVGDARWDRAMPVVGYLCCATTQASTRGGFTTAQLRHQRWSSATSQWHRNIASTAFKKGKSFLRFHELILSQKFNSMNALAMVQTSDKTQAASNEDENSEEQEEALHEFNKAEKTQGKEKGELEEAASEICEVLRKGDEDMEETLTNLGIRINQVLVKMVLNRTSSPRLALRFFKWAKLQRGFTHNTSTYNKLTNLIGRSKDFETLQKILAEMLPARRNYSVRTFSFATAWHDDWDMLSKVIEMIDKLEFSARRYAYEMLIAALCEENHANAALFVLERMVSANCGLRAVTFSPLITVFCMNGQLDKVQVLFEMMKMTGCPPDSMTYNLAFSKLCYIKRFVEAAEVLESMVDSGYQPDAFTYDIMINYACKTRKLGGALQFLDKMKEEGIKPLYGTYAHLLKGILLDRDFEEAYSFLIQQSGTDPNLDSVNYEYLIRICHKVGLEEEARHLFTEMKAKGLELLDDKLYTQILHENNEPKPI